MRRCRTMNMFLKLPIFSVICKYDFPEYEEDHVSPIFNVDKVIISDSGDIITSDIKGTIQVYRDDKKIKEFPSDTSIKGMITINDLVIAIYADKKAKVFKNNLLHTFKDFVGLPLHLHYIGDNKVIIITNIGNIVIWDFINNKKIYDVSSTSFIDKIFNMGELTLARTANGELIIGEPINKIIKLPGYSIIPLSITKLAILSEDGVYTFNPWTLKMQYNKIQDINPSDKLCVVDDIIICCEDTYIQRIDKSVEKIDIGTPITTMTLLKNRFIAIGDQSGYLRIYDPLSHQILLIKKVFNKLAIHYIIELSNGSLLIIPYNGHATIWKY